MKKMFFSSHYLFSWLGSSGGIEKWKEIGNFVVSMVPHIFYLGYN